MEAVNSVSDPVEAIYGMLSHVKKTGVELQHEVRRLRAARIGRYRKAASSRL
ncbi:MAG: hypothetical protein ACXQTF_04915 [Candidatus Hecatellaceae archaeon]